MYNSTFYDKQALFINMSNKNKKTGMKIIQKICFIIQLQKTLLCVALEPE